MSEEAGSCWLCDSNEGVEYCPGCRKYICPMHTTIFGRHKPEDHDEDDD